MHIEDEGTFTKQEIDKKGEKVTTKTSLSRYYVKSTVTLMCIESGQYIETSAYARERLEKTGSDEAQITGCSSSYAKKYALSGLFAIDEGIDADSEEKKK